MKTFKSNVLFMLLLSMSMPPDSRALEEKTYGTGLPRDLDVLAVPDASYPDWVSRQGLNAYPGVSGGRMKRWVREISAISLRSQQDGNQYWGRHYRPGQWYESGRT